MAASSCGLGGEGSTRNPPPPWCLVARWSHALSCVLRGITSWNVLSLFLLFVGLPPQTVGFPRRRRLVQRRVRGRGTAWPRASPPWSFAEGASEWHWEIGDVSVPVVVREPDLVRPTPRAGRSLHPGVPARPRGGRLASPQTRRGAAEAAAHGPAAHKAARRGGLGGGGAAEAGDALGFVLGQGFRRDSVSGGCVLLGANAAAPESGRSQARPVVSRG